MIAEFAGKPVTTPQGLQSAVERASIGREQTVSIVRDGKHSEIKTNLAEMSADSNAGSQERAAEKTSSLATLGIEVQNLTADLAKQLEISPEHGVVITHVRSGSPAEREA